MNPIICEPAVSSTKSVIGITKLRVAPTKQRRSREYSTPITQVRVDYGEIIHKPKA